MQHRKGSGVPRGVVEGICAQLPNVEATTQMGFRRLVRYFVVATVVLLTCQFLQRAHKGAQRRQFVMNQRHLSLLVTERLQIGCTGKLDCPVDCGCRDTPVDCKRRYEPKMFSLVIGQNRPMVDALEEDLSMLHSKAQETCFNSKTTCTGAWCLETDSARNESIHPPGHVPYPIAKMHVSASPVILAILGEMILQEKIKSITDLGAGIGQYGSRLLQNFPDLRYTAYDGAVNVANYTNGFVQWTDLSLPLNLITSEWVLSLEVGEHIPSKYEGFYIHNIHRHNCKGVVLSWGVLGQDGDGHVNNHSNEYVIKLMLELDYTLDVDLTQKMRRGHREHTWFKHSVMVFRRRIRVC